jgi:DNA-damage-inducible protein D
MNAKRTSLAPLRTLLSDSRIRRWDNNANDWTVYAVVDVLSVLADTAESAELWAHLRRREPELEGLTHTLELDGVGTVEVMDAEGILRLVAFVPGRRAQKLRNVLARIAVERLAEDDDPELALLRTREAYARAGHDRRWIDQRVRSVSGRQDLAGEWYRRGARASDDFRALTNELTQQCFGMDVATFRRSKGLTGTTESLRDHLSDLELSLLSLGETLAVTLHRERNSRGTEQLLRDVHDAGQMIASTRRALHQQLATTPQAA